MSNTSENNPLDIERLRMLYSRVVNVSILEIEEDERALLQALLDNHNLLTLLSAYEERDDLLANEYDGPGHLDDCEMDIFSRIGCGCGSRIEELLARDRILTEIEKVVEEYRNSGSYEAGWAFLLNTYDEARRRVEEGND